MNYPYSISSKDSLYFFVICFMFSPFFIQASMKSAHPFISRFKFHALPALTKISF